MRGPAARPPQRCDDPPISEPASTNLLLSTGARLTVQGAADEVGKRLQDAVRSSPGTVAWLEQAGTGEAVGVNPAHVVALTRGEQDL
jgi:hypothetical protein